MGKEALAKAPTIPLPAEIVARAKTGFAVPTGAWMNAATGKAAARRTGAVRSRPGGSRRAAGRKPCCTALRDRSGAA